MNQGKRKQILSFLLSLLFLFNCVFTSTVFADYEDGLIIPAYDSESNDDSNIYDYDYNYEVTPDDTWINSVETPKAPEKETKTEELPALNEIPKAGAYTTTTGSAFVFALSYAALCYDYGQERSEEILELITETVCTTKSTLRIGGQYWSSETVKSHFLKLDMMHIQYVFECLDKNTTEIHNIRAYLLSTLYNAPITINSYYKARVNYDLYG